MKKIVIFDLDGTLIDSRADITTSVNLTRQQFGLAPLRQEDVVLHIGQGARNQIEKTIPEFAERIEETLAAYRQLYREHVLDQTTLYPGIYELLSALHNAGYVLAVITNKPADLTEAILSGLDIRGFFALVIGGGSGLALKPDPAPLLYALEQTNSQKEGSWMVGDHHTDLEAGRRAGLKRCFCAYGFGDPKHEQWDIKISAPLELLNQL